MDKINSLREHLVARVSPLNTDPDRLLIFVDKGKLASKGLTLSFEYRYTAHVIITEFAGHADAVMVPVIEWYKRHQPDTDIQDGVRFEADILNHASVDLSLYLDLTERVIVTQDADGRVTDVHHCGEPTLDNEVFPWPPELLINGAAHGG